MRIVVRSGLDVTPPRKHGPHEFVSIDVCGPQVKDALGAFRPDTVVHLAFIVNPIHDEVLMRDINVKGSRNGFGAVLHSKALRFLAASSVTVYGTWPDDPVPLDDDAPLRSHVEFSYSTDNFARAFLPSQNLQAFAV